MKRLLVLFAVLLVMAVCAGCAGTATPEAVPPEESQPEIQREVLTLDEDTRNDYFNILWQPLWDGHLTFSWEGTPEAYKNPNGTGSTFDIKKIELEKGAVTGDITAYAYLDIYGERYIHPETKEEWPHYTGDNIHVQPQQRGNDFFPYIKQGESVVTIKNGTLIANGELTSGAYGTVRTEGTANVTLEDVKLYSYRGYGLNVKANSGTTITINDSEIYSQYSGGVEAAGGTIELNDVTIDQKGVYSNAAWCSVAIGVNGGGKVTVNSGNYSASTISTDSNAAQGTWVAYVMSSGGTLEINGGTFNGTVAETAAAANACGIICADRAAVVTINGGTFESNGAILDMRNNDGSLPNPIATLAGGSFSADPRVSGLYSSNLISVADGCEVVENKDGTWTVKIQPVAKINLTEYTSLQEAFNVGGEITLLRNVTLAETLMLAEGKDAVLDLNGKTLAAADKNTIKNVGGNLTIKNGIVTRTGDVVGYSVNNESGEITVKDATVERGLYTSGSKMTATNANISHNQSSRHAIYAWNCEVTINSGTFHNDNAGNATLMASGSSVVTINGGTFSIADGSSTLGWTSSMIDQNSTAQVLVKGGLFNGGFRINSADTKLTIEGGEFNTNNGSAFTDYSGTKVVKGGKFTDTGAQNWAKKYIAEGYEMNANGEVVAK